MQTISDFRATMHILHEKAPPTVEPSSDLQIISFVAEKAIHKEPEESAHTKTLIKHCITIHDCSSIPLAVSCFTTGLTCYFCSPTAGAVLIASVGSTLTVCNLFCESEL